MAEISIPTIIGMATVLGTGHLFAGLAIGWVAGRQTRSSPATPLNVQPIVASMEGLRSELSELGRLAKEQEASKEIVALIARLALALDELQRTVVQSPAERAIEPDTERSHRMGTRAVSNGRILEWFRGSEITTPTLDEPLRRYPFAVRQFVAPMDGEELPAPAAFQGVQCHDLCPSELRYITDERPRADVVVIGIGLPRPVKFLSARIEDYRSVFMYGRVGFLVTAQFIAAIDHPPYQEHFGAQHEPAHH